MATNKATTGALTSEARAWAEALSDYTPVQDDIAHCHCLLENALSSTLSRENVLLIMDRWLYRRYPRLWLYTPRGMPPGEASVAREQAIVMGTWDVFLPAFEKVNVLKALRPSVVIQMLQPGGPVPIIKDETRVPILLQASPWATLPDLLAAVRGAYKDTIAPRLYRESPKEHQEGNTPRFKQQVWLYVAFLTYCQDRGKAPNHEDEVLRKEFLSAIVRKRHPIPTPLPSKPDRTTVEVLFRSAVGWLPRNPSEPSIDDTLAEAERQ